MLQILNIILLITNQKLVLDRILFLVKPVLQKELNVTYFNNLGEIYIQNKPSLKPFS